VYVALFPCNECAKAIIQCGIKKVFYLSDKYNGTSGNLSSKRMFDAAGVEYKQLSLPHKEITINFDESLV
jgi:dCMP deaminase